MGGPSWNRNRRKFACRPQTMRVKLSRSSILRNEGCSLKSTRSTVPEVLYSEYSRIPSVDSVLYQQLQILDRKMEISDYISLDNDNKREQIFLPEIGVVTVQLRDRSKYNIAADLFFDECISISRLKILFVSSSSIVHPSYLFALRYTGSIRDYASFIGQLLPLYHWTWWIIQCTGENTWKLKLVCSTYNRLAKFSDAYLLSSCHAIIFLRLW